MRAYVLPRMFTSAVSLWCMRVCVGRTIVVDVFFRLSFVFGSVLLWSRVNIMQAVIEMVRCVWLVGVDFLRIIQYYMWSVFFVVVRLVRTVITEHANMRCKTNIDFVWIGCYNKSILVNFDRRYYQTKNVE